MTLDEAFRQRGTMVPYAALQAPPLYRALACVQQALAEVWWIESDPYGDTLNTIQACLDEAMYDTLRYTPGLFAQKE